MAKIGCFDDSTTFGDLKNVHAELNNALQDVHNGVPPADWKSLIEGYTSPHPEKTRSRYSRAIMKDYAATKPSIMTLRGNSSVYAADTHDITKSGLSTKLQKSISSNAILFKQFFENSRLIKASYDSIAAGVEADSVGILPSGVSFEYEDVTIGEFKKNGNAFSVESGGITYKTGTNTLTAVEVFLGNLTNLACFDPEDLKAIYSFEINKLAGELVQDEAGAARKTYNPLAAGNLFKSAAARGAATATLGRAAATKAASATAASAKALFADEVVYQEQCFLLANLGSLVQQKKASTTPFPLPYTAGTATGSAGTLLNHPIHIQGNAFAFVNKLVVSPDQKQLFELTPAELSSITPHMRFFKVESGPDGKDIEQEIKFDSNVSNDLIEYMSRTKNKQGGRGLGVGVTSFDFSYDGTDPFSAKKAISAKLSIYAPSFSDLLKERAGNKINYRYVDLALKTGRNKATTRAEAVAQQAEDVKNKLTLQDVEKENLEKLNFRLKVLVEWTASKAQTKLLNSDKKTALYNSAISIYLTPTIHEFNFDDAGGVTFSINYLAYIEDYFAQQSFDIFGSLTVDKKARDLCYDYFRQTNCDYDGQDFVSFKEADELFILNSNSSALQTIINRLRTTNSIYNLAITKKQMREWLTSPYDDTSYIASSKISTFQTLDKDIVFEAAKAASGSSGIDKSLFNLSLISNSDLVENTAFFYLSDLVDAAMFNIEEALQNQTKISDSEYFKEVIEPTTNLDKLKDFIEIKNKQKKIPKTLAAIEQFKKMRVVLGPMEIVPKTKSFFSKRAIGCTVGDIPISLTYFLDFMSEKILSKDFIQYPFSKFIKDIINDCIRNFINADGCFASNQSQKASLNSTTVLAYNMIPEDTGAKDDLSNFILSGGGTYSSKNCLILDKISNTSFPILKISGPRGDERKTLSVETMRNYFIFNIGRRYPTDAYVGEKDLDSQNGVFHYILGQDKGIVKNINLDRTSAPGLKELRFEQEGFDGLEQLREVYNANITTFLNPQTFPGVYIYVEPKGFDPTATQDLSKYGIGGYYMITKTSHKITPGDSETVLNASWVASKNGSIVKKDKKTGKIVRDEEGSNDGARKCKVRALAESNAARDLR